MNFNVDVVHFCGLNASDVPIAWKTETSRYLCNHALLISAKLSHVQKSIDTQTKVYLN